MKFTIFSKLVAGYLAIFLLIIIVSIYVAVQLQKLENATDSILNIDNRMLNYNKKLTDTLLSQVQYEKTTTCMTVLLRLRMILTSILEN
jgi:CHASE3 domain sensor protein